MSGYPTGTLRRDFAIAGISFRQKITNLSGIPLLAVAEAKAAVSSDYDPFIDQDSPEGRLLRAENLKLEETFTLCFTRFLET